VAAGHLVTIAPMSGSDIPRNFLEGQVANSQG
jgi:hypothetical protein